MLVHLTAGSRCNALPAYIQSRKRQTLSTPHCIFLFHWQMCFRWYESLSSCCNRALLSLFTFFHLSLLLGPWSSQFLFLLFMSFFVIPASFSHWNPLLKLPWGRIFFLHPTLQAFFSHLEYFSLSSHLFSFTRAVSRGICHHWVHRAPIDDVFKLDEGEKSGNTKEWYI